MVWLAKMVYDNKHQFDNKDNLLKCAEDLWNTVPVSFLNDRLSSTERYFSKQCSIKEFLHAIDYYRAFTRSCKPL